MKTRLIFLLSWFLLPNIVFSTEKYPISRPVLDYFSPLSFAPFQLRAEDLVIQIPNEVELEATPITKSLEWVRVKEIVQIPRLRVHFKSKTPVTLIHSGIETPVIQENTILVTPFSPLWVRLPSDKVYPITWKFKFPETRVGVDPSCSTYKVKLNTENSASLTSSGGIVHVGCQSVLSIAGAKSIPIVEFHITWIGRPKNDLTVQTALIKPQEEDLFIIRTGPESQPQEYIFYSDSRFLKLKYKLPKRTKLISINAGLGPYQYSSRFELNSSSQQEKWVPLLTLYGSYTISDITRIVYFNAMPMGGRFFSDMGLYFHQEASRFLDERIRVNVLLGGNLRVLRSNESEFVTKIGGPQGVEFVFKDAGWKLAQASLGAFFYPEIDNKSYKNIWIRYGMPPWFLEMNYISWKEPLENNQRAIAKSLGISIGFPLFKLL